MTNAERKMIVEQKIKQIASKGDLDKRQGVLRKLRRELRALNAL